MTPTELTEACKDACDLCRVGNAATYRVNTREWTHTIYQGSNVRHTLCRASALRNQDLINREGR